MTCFASLTLAGLLTNAVRRHGQRPALSFGENTYTYADLDAASNALANGLRALGIQRGASVALHLRNSIEYVIADLAILKLAAIKVPLNELMVPEELEHCLRHSDAWGLISDAALPAPNFAALPNLAVHVIAGAMMGKAVRPGAMRWEEMLSADNGEISMQSAETDTAIIMYTGGTTGKPKGVVHTQHAMALNLLAHVCCTDIRSDEVMLLQTPLPHSAGFYLQACLLQGGRIVLRRKFEAHAFLQTVVATGATWTFAVPTMVYRLLDELPACRLTDSTLRTIVYGAAPMDPSRLALALELFGPVFLQIYGQTECPNLITTLAKEEHQDVHRRSSCGRAVPFVEIRLLDSEGAIIEDDAVGELCVRSPYQLRGYHQDTATTQKTIIDGWLHTGDLAYRDSRGYLFIVDRAKDMIISGGMNVYCVEVEAVLRRSEAVKDVAVIGIKDRDWGEAVVAVVVKRAEIDINSLMNFCRQNLSAYKVPKRIEFADTIPVTSYGKADKKALRAMLSSG